MVSLEELLFSLSKAGTAGSLCLWHGEYLHFAWQTRGMHPWRVHSLDDGGLRLLACAVRKASEWEKCINIIFMSSVFMGCLSICARILNF